MSGDAKGGDPSAWSNAGVIGAGTILLLGFARWGWGRCVAIWQTYPVTLGVLAVLALVLLIIWAFGAIWNRSVEKSDDKAITAEDETAVYLGKGESGELIHLKQRFRTTHTQVIGTTSAGKTESVILPWAIRDIETGAGMLVIDGKSDKSFLEKFYAYAVRAGRKKDFRLFSLALVEPSFTFNPLVGGSPLEVAERVFSSFKFENEYFRNVQYKVFLSIIQMVVLDGKVPTFALVQRLLTDPALLKQWVGRCTDNDLKHDLGSFLKESDRERNEKISGLDANLTQFCRGELAQLFNAEDPQIQMDEALSENLICYFQLPSMYYPKLAEATGKLVLQSFQNAVAKRHLGLASKPSYFSCFLDDFQDYIYEGFGALLNKSRSANVGVVFSHQALGDLDKVSPAFRNVVLTNTNVKCVMRNNDPDTCEYFAKSFGTSTTEKVTERQTKGLVGDSRTGDGSVREVEEFRFHPNSIRNLGTGEGIVTIPHFKGIKVVKVGFQRREDIEPVRLPRIYKAPRLDVLGALPNHVTEQSRPRLPTDELN
jgi:type IV secretory pathway TraG/TraD family ATPase VirD4